MSTTGDEMTDEECARLARDLYRYITVHDWTDDSISELVSDIAMSQDVTSDELDAIRQEIEERFA